MVFLVIPVNVLIFRRAVPAHTPPHALGIVKSFGRRRLYRYLGFTSIASIFDQGLQAALPLVVIAVLGATQDAYFYIPFTIVMSMELLADNAVTALTVEGSFAADRVQELTIAVGRRLLLILVPLSVVLIVAAPIVLRFFGQDYVDHGTTVLRLLAAASLFRGTIWVYMAVCRIQGRGSVASGEERHQLGHGARAHKRVCPPLGSDGGWVGVAGDQCSRCELHLPDAVAVHSPAEGAQ